MGIARKLVLLALTVVAVMAVNVSAASAVEVIEEPPMGATNGSHCSPTITEEVATMCNLTGASVGHMELGGPFGIMILCNVTLAGGASESGRLIATSYDVIETSCENGTMAHECTSLTPGHRHPSAEPTNDPLNFPIDLEARFCADVEAPLNLGEIECHLPGTLTRVGAAPSHQYQLNFLHSNPCEGGTGFSLEGIVRTPTESGVEVLP